MGVSLWLVPTAAQMDVVRSGFPRRPSIDQPLSPSSFPAIIPHVTLATVPLSDPGILDELLNAVPENQQPIRVNFRSLSVGDHYFRSVFIDVQPTQELFGFQSQIMINLRLRGLEPSAPRFPHMSLCYIADEDKSHRDRTAQVLRGTGLVHESIDTQSVSLQCGEISLSGFDGTDIWVAKCDGPVETWEVYERKMKLTLKA